MLAGGGTSYASGPTPDGPVATGRARTLPSSPLLGLRHGVPTVRPRMPMPSLPHAHEALLPSSTGTADLTRTTKVTNGNE